MLGEEDSGKTSIIIAYLKNEFNYGTIRTTGIDSYYIKLKFDNLEYKLKIFDSIGQERNRSISTATTQKADGIAMVFSVDDNRSYSVIVNWIKYIKEYANLEEKVLFIIGNKIDVKPEERLVKKEEVEEFAKKWMLNILKLQL